MTKLVRCRQCSVELVDDRCQFAVHKRVIDGKEYDFCCEKCAERYMREEQENT